MVNNKIWPSADAKPFNRSTPNLKHVITSRISSSKNWLNLPQGHLFVSGVFAPQTRNIHAKPSNVLHLFQFFRAPTDKAVERIFAFNTQYDLVLRKKMFFWGWENLILKFNWLIRKKSKNLYWRLWGNFKKILNSHNSGCTQDRVVIFDSRVGFSGTAYLTASYKFTPRWPLLPWQRNLGQNQL